MSKSKAFLNDADHNQSPTAPARSKPPGTILTSIHNELIERGMNKMASWQSLKTQPPFSADTMLLLTDGTVMVHELNTANWHRLTPDSSGSYINGSWSALAPLPDNSGIPAAKGGPTNAPLYFASAVLADGTVFVAGGEYNTGKGDADILTAQIYDPPSNTWTAIATPSNWSGIGDAPSCVLGDGRLLLGSFASGQTAILDPATRTWQAGGKKGDSCSEETFTLLPNGNVLTVQCSNAPNAEQYLPGSNTWVSAGSTGETLPQACSGFVPEIGPALLLPDGRVFAVGATGATALYTPDPDPAKAGTWANGPTLKDSENNTSYPMDVPGVLLPNGKVMVLGAPGPPCNFPSPTTVFLYDPATNTAAVIGGPSNADGAPYGARLLLVPTGQVLYSASRKDIEVYTPDPGGQASWKPTITDFPAAFGVGKTIKIFGTQFNGLSQACSYGDDAQMATNYPVVRMQTAGKTYYLRTFNHSTMAVATGSTNVNTNVDVPTNLPKGAANMVVIANGIASDPVSVEVVGAPVAAGDPDGYMFNAQGTQHVIYRGNDEHIYELWRDITGWNYGDLTGSSAAPNAAGNPHGYMFNAQGTQHINYRGADNHIFELWWDGNWHSGDLTVASSAPAASGDPHGYMFDAQGTQHVIYRGTDNHVHELWWDVNGWHSGDLTVATGSPVTAGDPRGYVFDAQGTQHVIYRGQNDHVYELWWDANGWHYGDLTAATGAPIAVSDPHGYVFNAQGTQHVNYRGADNHIYELWWDGNGWHYGDLTEATGAPAAAGDPHGYMFDAQGTQHVNYRGTNDHVYELWWDGNGWHYGDLTEATGAPTAIGDPHGYMFDAQGTQHVNYRSPDNHVYELWWDINGWHPGDLTP